MVCKPENTTKPAAFGQRVATTSISVCLCDEDDGFFEDGRGHHCAGAAGLTASITSLMAALMGAISLTRRFS